MKRCKTFLLKNEEEDPDKSDEFPIYLKHLKKPHPFTIIGEASQGFGLHRYNNNDLHAISGGIVRTTTKQVQFLGNRLAKIHQDYFVLFLNDDASFAHQSILDGQALYLEGHIEFDELYCDYQSNVEYMGSNHQLEKDEYLTTQITTFYVRKWSLIGAIDNVVNVTFSRESQLLRRASY